MRAKRKFKKKIFNDPVYGFINFPHTILYELIDHPYIQRLRRIKQVGLTDYVYPGASHSRFNHCLGALHLMTQAIQSLRWKGVAITEAESEAVSIAILLHDIGHGPFSHALEKMILPVSHEMISLEVMHLLNDEFDGRLNLAIDIFSDNYDKPFLHELVSSQLDMDRMDYLNRDSFYTGVVEGMIGYDRIIKMFNVVDGHLVVEEKAKLSVEQFLMARRMMYWQVYLHKTVLAVEKMLHNLFMFLHEQGNESYYELMPENLAYFARNFKVLNSSKNIEIESLKRFLTLDDSDIFLFLKELMAKTEGPANLLARGIIERHVFRVRMENDAFRAEELTNIKEEIELRFGAESSRYLLITGLESSATYSLALNEIKVLLKDGSSIPFSQLKDLSLQVGSSEKYYMIFPRNDVNSD